MTQPLFSIKHVATEALLPKKLTIGRAYFVADEKEIIIDHGDGRGPVRYGSKPGPQGMPGEPIPSLQGQIDELAEASLATSRNIHLLNERSRTDFEHLQKIIQDNIDMLKNQDDENASAILSLLLTVNKKFTDYDSAINILASTLANLYPASQGGTAGDGTNDTPKGIITADDGTSYKIEQAYTQGDTGVIVLTLYDTSAASKLKEGDKVNIDSGYFVVNDLTASGEGGIIALTLYSN